MELEVSLEPSSAMAWLLDQRKFIAGQGYIYKSQMGRAVELP